ncbi:protein phosphatase 2C domain-containing protein [Psychroserpens sp. NJDZ02]|uniref:protein phosphatase 2C domain-containing protein n=1 Tax=Psychroserpens sp. NJDZ02 TaxID=2570561 RepID=UPI0010A88FD0|nr:protein phosphatase 2C domain-containing protein [Psychroserpens sp. NJDZ02]QCE42401.1 protein phosphatase 2C domain-containing protein [Psychroserpens sp. NJDZ02]
MNFNSAIIKGPEKKVLQDAFGIINQKQFSLLVVADGLGSAEHSGFGAKKAIDAVQKAVSEWQKLEKKDIKVLIQLVQFYWNLLIGDSDFEKKECATTCLFAYIDKLSNTIILSQLGDGLVMCKTKKETILLKSAEEYNFTKSLGSSKSYKDWNIKHTDFDSDGFNLLLTTDGISEDLVESKEDQFMEGLIEKMKSTKRNKRNGYLHQLLKNWPTKYHTDDKTICIAWEKKK